MKIPIRRCSESVNPAYLRIPRKHIDGAIRRVEKEVGINLDIAAVEKAVAVRSGLFDHATSRIAGSSNLCCDRRTSIRQIDGCDLIVARRICCFGVHLLCILVSELKAV